MQEWHNRISDMLAYVNDVLTPHGLDDIVKDDFASLRQMLSQEVLQLCRSALMSWADMVLAPSVAGLFKWRQFEPEVILLAV